MAAAVLEYVGEWFKAKILAELRSQATPAARIRLMSDRLNQFYDCGQSACLLALFTLGEADNLFHQQVSRMLKAWIDSLAQVIAEADIPAEQARRRAEDAVIQIQGALVLTRGLDSTEPFKRVLQQLPTQLLEPVSH